MSETRRQRRLRELGLLDQVQQPNPYEVLGLHPRLALELLNEDVTGEALKTVVSGLYRLLSRRYHTDTGGDTARFQAINSANTRIAGAQPETLRRWVGERVVAISANEKMQRQQATFLNRAAQLVQQNMELGADPRHFSQVKWSQGLLLRRGDGIFLLREEERGGIEVLPAKSPLLNPQIAGQGFRSFLQAHSFFGLQPDSKIVAYLDETRRASILDPESLGFLMDITHVARNWHSQDPQETAWMRFDDPLFIAAAARNPEAQGPEAKTSFTIFPSQVGVTTSDNMAWRLPFMVAGSVADPQFHKHRQPRATNTRAVGSVYRGPSANHFSVVPTSTEAMIATDVGYTPLIQPRNALLLFDRANHTLNATDAIVVGMLGNGAQLP